MRKIIFVIIIGILTAMGVLYVLNPIISKSMGIYTFKYYTNANNSMCDEMIRFSNVLSKNINKHAYEIEMTPIRMCNTEKTNTPYHCLAYLRSGSIDFNAMFQIDGACVVRVTKNFTVKGIKTIAAPILCAQQKLEMDEIVKGIVSDLNETHSPDIH